MNSEQNQVVNLTSNAILRVKDYAKKPDSQNKYFRVSVQAGGCSGFEYDFNFSEKKDSDLIVHVSDVDILVDSASVTYLQGSTVDFVDDFKGTGFKVENPQSKGSCGCGVSFTV